MARPIEPTAADLQVSAAFDRSKTERGTMSIYFIDEAVRLLDLDHHPMREGSYALMCHSALSSANLYQALKRILRFMHLVLDDLDPALEVREGKAYLHLRDTRPEPPLFAHATLFVQVLGLACWLIGRRMPIMEGSFQSAAPGEAAIEYQTLFCEHLRFAQQERCGDGGCARTWNLVF